MPKRDVLTSKQSSLVQTPCAKTAKSCAFCDCTPVSQKAALFATVRRFPVLPTSLCKSSRILQSRILGIVCRFSLWNVFPPMKPAFFFPNSAPLNSGLWLTAFGKLGLFRCQSGIRRLWLEAFDKSGFFRCQSRSSRPTLLPLETPVLPTAVCKS